MYPVEWGLVFVGVKVEICQEEENMVSWRILKRYRRISLLAKITLGDNVNAQYNSKVDGCDAGWEMGRFWISSLCMVTPSSSKGNCSRSKATYVGISCVAFWTLQSKVSIYIPWSCAHYSVLRWKIYREHSSFWCSVMLNVRNAIARWYELHSLFLWFVISRDFGEGVGQVQVARHGL